MRIALAVLASMLVVPASVRAVEVPDSDPFYKPPANLAKTKPGDILRTREVEVSLGPLPTGATATAHQLLYRTNDAHNRPVTTVATVLVPKTPAPPGGRNLVSLQDATNSSDLKCAPSYQLQIGAPDNKNILLETSSIGLAGLAAGATVVIPDHLGPRSQYVVKGMEAHATLDGIRAAEAFEASQVDGVATQVALVGYSGGAHASASANELQPQYAPELNIVAVAAGGVPPVNRDTFRTIDGGLGTGVLLGVSIAIDDAFPKFGLAELLNERGTAFVEKHRKGCASSVFAAPGEHLNDFTKVPDIIDIPRVARIIERNALGHATPTAPTFYYNGVFDELIHIEVLDELVAKYCAGGARIRYVRDPAGLEHIQALANFVPLAEAYIADRFAGRPVPNDCPPPTAVPDPPPCVGKVAVRVHVRRAIKVRRITVRSGGRLVGRVRHRARRVRVTLTGPTAKVTIRIVGRRHGKRVGITQRRTVRVCGSTP
jgi:hypothetical protein